MTAALQPASDALRPKSRPASRSKLALIDAAWVCHHLPEFAHLTQADKAILCALIRHIDQCALDSGRSTVFPSTLCLALDTGYTVRQVLRSLGRLETARLIRRFTPPRWRTAHTDIAGFMAHAADVLEAHAEEKDRQLRAVRRGPIAVFVEDAESPRDDIASPPTETEIDPEISVEQSDAARGRFSRRPDKPAAANRTILPPPGDGSCGRAAFCSPGRAGFSAGAGSEPTIPAERVRAALSAAWEGLPTLRRLVDLDQLRTASLETLAAIVQRDYLAAVTEPRNPQHIWSWAINRHGLGNTILGWIIACDTPSSADRPERNPAGWFTRFATSEKPWDLSRNLRQLALAARSASTLDEAATGGDDLTSTTEPAEVDIGSAADLLGAYRAAWIRAAAVRLGGRQKADAAWMAWLSEAAVVGVDEDFLQIWVKTKFARDQLFKDYGDVCRIAAEDVGYTGADFVTGQIRS